MRTLAIAAGLMTCAGAVHAATISLDSLDTKLDRGTGKVKVSSRELSFTADETGQISVARQKIKNSSNQDIAEVSIDALLEADPFIAYGIAVTNYTNAAQTFTFTFSSPYIDGPYNTLDSSHSSSITDSGSHGQKNDRVVVTPSSGNTYIHRPSVDGINIAGTNIATGCNVNPPGPGGGSDMCHSSSFLSVPVSTLGTGNFNVVVSFTLSAYDIYTGNGRVELRNVPDGASTALLLFAAVGVVVAAHRRVSRAA